MESAIDNRQARRHRMLKDGKIIFNRRASIIYCFIGDRGAGAEGIETAADLQVLIGMGYDMAQGYYFAKPMTGEAFIERLSRPASEV